MTARPLPAGHVPRDGPSEVKLTREEYTHFRATGEVPQHVLDLLPPHARFVRLPPEEEARLREAFAESIRNPGRALTREELAHWAETGEWPES